MARGHAQSTGVHLTDVVYEVHYDITRDTLAVASGLMRIVWPRPSLDYSPEFLHWQMTFPSELPARYVIGMQGSRCVAFAGATPRKMHSGERSATVFAKSFVTVARDLQGRGIGREVRRRVLASLEADACPVVRFGEHLPPGSRVLEEDYGLSGMDISRMGDCFGGATQSDGSAIPRFLTPTEFSEVASEHVSGTALRVDNDEATLKHYLTDPRGRVLLGVPAPDGKVCVAAMAVAARVVTHSGTTTSVQLEQLVTTSAATPKEVKGLAQAAAQWGYRGPGIVSVLNLGSCSWGLFARAGFRRLPSRYAVWMAFRKGDPRPFESSTIDLEIT